ncbi:transcriptional regulator [Paenibacillus sambharensis]|uniref:Transcriptional regulator n=1 Tax=Paenibacillus sambharensis TaxID=1803190 RepID=A0A2W1L6W2_9BACL|nr:MerR family transcriptional regulator [Paenibacillus sambharensis]PZD95958.1 transcriptional regulator [Paenibacillus sambharensis]
MGDTKLYRIGELAKKAELSPRTIDFYTKLGLITPAKRSDNNYRLYGDGTLERLARIEQMKKEKYTLDEIKALLDQWGKVSEEQVNRKLTDLEIRLTQLQREVQELEPVIDRLKPQQARNVYKRLMPQTAACIEALMLLIGKGPLM